MISPDRGRLIDIVRRQAPASGEWAKIPWDEPAFSARMLAEHLTQEHDRASRRASLIETHVSWLHAQVLAGHPASILDLGCGPGLYTSRLAALGHDCTGIDFAPAAIDYARRAAQERSLACNYRLADIRAADYGHGFDLVMLLFGEFNAFHPDEARAILRKAREAMRTAGTLVIEAQREEAIREMGQRELFWTTAERGVFSDRPHLRLDEAVWDDARRTTTQRYYVVDAETAEVDCYLERHQAYSEGEYRQMLHDAGLKLQEILPGMPGADGDNDFLVLIAKLG